MILIYLFFKESSWPWPSSRCIPALVPTAPTVREDTNHACRVGPMVASERLCLEAFWRHLVFF